ncbi:MAG TPA: hypothetical protein VGL54_00725 [Solirubrobacteraceae bacterium]|jgi:hypothetical protein
MSTSSKPTIHSFTLFFSAADVLEDGRFDALYEAGCDDALFGVRDGAQYGAFNREAASFSEALASAIHDVTAAVADLRVVRIEPDELVTMAAIAKRSGLSREYIRLLSTDARGPGGFPAPVAYADSRTRLWHWPDVAHWMTLHRKAKVQVDAQAADLVAAMNAVFDLREHVGHLQSEYDLALVAQALGEAPPICTAALMPARLLSQASG